nr:hypothetical protein Iba_chr11aCG9890 [Ipomoea batatas]
MVRSWYSFILWSSLLPASQLAIGVGCPLPSLVTRRCSSSSMLAVAAAAPRMLGAHSCSRAVPWPGSVASRHPRGLTPRVVARLAVTQGAGHATEALRPRVTAAVAGTLLLL